MWTRQDGQSVEDAVLGTESCEFPMRYQPHGESVAINDDDSGFFTVSDRQKFSPIYFYKFRAPK